MAEDVIDHFIDRNGIRQDKEYFITVLKDVQGELKHLNEVAANINVSKGLAGISPIVTQAADSMKKMDSAVELATKTLAEHNGHSKEFSQVLLIQAKAQNELSKATLNEAKAQTEATKEKREAIRTSQDAEKQKRAEAKAVEDASNDYLQLSKAYNDAANKAKNYFIVLGENHPTTVQAIKDANDIGNVLKRADAAVGQFQRNVGNYKSAFDGLGFSFAQLGRELPSLAINLQTFALAISNNLPIVADEIAKAKKEIAALKAEGKETPSLFQRIKGSILSFQTALSVGITLLTIFAGKLFGAADGSKQLKKETDDLNDSLREQKEALDDINELTDRQTRIDLNKLREKGASDQQLYDRELRGKKEQLKKLQEAEDEARRIKEDEYEKAIKKQTIKAELGFDKISKKEIAAYVERNKVLNKNIEDAEKARIAKEDEIEEFRSRYRADQAEKARDEAKRNAEKAKEDAKDAKERADAELQLEFDLQEIKLRRKADFNKEVADDDSKSFTVRHQALVEYYEAEREIILLNEELQKKLGKKSAKEIELVEAQSYDARLRLDREFEQKRIEIIEDTAKKFSEEEKRINEAAKDYISERVKEYEKEYKKRQDEAKKAADKEIELEKQKNELKKKLASELTEFVFTLFTASFERQKNELQAQIDLLEAKKAKDIEEANQTITNEQEKAAKIQTIQARAAAQKEQLQKRQREFDIKKAQFDKAQSIARIIQETAENVVKYFANPVLAGLAAAIGAVQLATVIAQPIPRYKHGKNLSDLYEGPAIVDDGGKPEAIIRQDGSVEVGGDKPRMTYLGKRDIVLPDANMLADMVVAGYLGGGIKAISDNKPNSDIARIERGLKDVVVAVQNKKELNLNASEGGLSAMWKHAANQIKYINDQTNWNA